MIRIKSSEEIISIIDYFRNGDYLTNLYSVPGLWLNKEIFYYESFETSVFFFKKNPDFYNIYYCAIDQIALKFGLLRINKLYPKETFVFDVINGNQLFNSLEYETHTTLVRMSRTPTENEFELDSFIRRANNNDVEGIQLIFNKYFDKYSEHIPLEEDLRDWINKGTLYVYCEDEILGFIIFDLLGLKSYLRYWFVHPDHRDKHIGSMLLKQFFYDAMDTRRQILWVISDNENAIKRYEHYGFQKEKLTNYVYIRRGN